MGTKAKSSKSGRSKLRSKHARWASAFNAGKGLKHRRERRRLARLEQRKLDRLEQQQGMVALD